jgi:hypothetical protein
MSHKENKKIIDVLNDCAAECSHCMIACLDENEVKTLAKCIKLEIDCAEICRLTASYASRGSEHAAHIMMECAEICNACAAECEKHSYMEHCKRCAQACINCAEECIKFGRVAA